MIYHAVPMPHPSKLPTNINGFPRREILELHSEMLKTVAKLSSESSEHYSQLIYLFNENVGEILQRIQLGDTLIIHAEGNPFVIGPGISNTKYCLTAGELAGVLVSNALPNIDCTIKILSCNSGTPVEERTFAQDCSQAFYYLHKFNKVIVEGYNGFIVVKKNSRYSATAISNSYSKRLPKSISKGTHARIEEVSCSYKKGRALTEPHKTLIENTDNPYVYLDESNRADMFYLEKTYGCRHAISIQKSVKKLLKFSAEEPELIHLTDSFHISKIDTKAGASPISSPSKMLLISPRARSSSRSSPHTDIFGRP